MTSTLYRSPFGPIELQVDDGLLTRVCLGRAVGAPLEERDGPVVRFVAALNRYFAGLEPVLGLDAVDLSGLTDFQRRVLVELRRVPRGQVLTYGELARRVGCPQGAQAVGGALGANPVPIFVPCHRVICAGGKLGGFGGGRVWKENLLRHEGRIVEKGRVA